MTTPVRVGLVGLGAIAMDAHLPALSRSRHVELAALVDPDGGRCSAAAAQAPHARTYRDLHDVPDGALDAVVLATPPWITSRLIGEVLDRGLFCLAEKPITTDEDGLRRLGSMPADQRGRLQVGLTYRHDPAMERLRDWITSGRLGGPLVVRAHIYDERREHGDTAYARRMIDTMAHGSPVMHEGAHVFDWLRYLLRGTPRVVDAWSLRTDTTLPDSNIDGARLTWSDGSVAVVEIGWWTDAQPPCQLSVLGSRGHAVLDVATFALTLDSGAGPVEMRFPGERTGRSFDRQLARFVELVTGRRREPEPGLADGLAAFELSRAVVAASHGMPR